MDADSLWVFNALQGILPAQTLQILNDHVFHPSSTIRMVATAILDSTQKAMQLLIPLLQPVIDRLFMILQDSPDVVFFGFLLALIFFAFYVFLLVQRTMYFVMRLAFRAVLWSLLGLAVMAVWQRGPEVVAHDVIHIVSRLIRYGAVVKDVWLSEYSKYDAQTRSAAGPGSLGGRGGSMGGGRSGGFSRSGR